jgi:hypothetical protein
LALRPSWTHATWCVRGRWPPRRSRRTPPSRVSPVAWAARTRIEASPRSRSHRPSPLGYGDDNNGGDVRGRVACWVGQDNASYLLWTEDEFAAEALVTIPNGGGQGIYTLWNWFVDPGHSAFGP